MRASTALSVFFVLGFGATASAAPSWDHSHGPGMRLLARPATDADIARQVAQQLRTTPTPFDHMAERFGFKNGEAELFVLPTGPGGARGVIDSKGFELRWQW
jgi:hypothetical protein